MTRPEPVLAAAGIVAGYGDLDVVRGASVQVGPGEVVVLVGPNGAGKSTLVKALFGLLVPRAGTVVLDGRDLSGLAPEERVRAGMAYVPQVQNVFATLTVEENLFMGAYTLGKGVDAAARRVYGLFPDLKPKRRQRAQTLSGGMRQMLAIGRALVTSPRVLLLDEPSAGLAPRLQTDVFRHVARIRASGTGVLLVEQNARAALGIADWAYVMDAGREAFQGPASAVLAHPDVGRLYLGGA